MAKKTVFVSDLSGDAIEEGKGAKIRITFDDARRGRFELSGKLRGIEAQVGARDYGGPGE